MRRALSGAMAEAARSGAGPLLYAAGHDHSLQFFRGDRAVPYTLVSGFGSKAKSSEVRHDRTTLFAHANPANPGFMISTCCVTAAPGCRWSSGPTEHPKGVEVYAMTVQRPRPAPAPGRPNAATEQPTL